MKVSVEGPLWYEIIQMANKKLIALQEAVINRNFIKELKPLLTLTKALAWDSIGSSLLNRVNIVNVIKLQGKSALRQRQVLNTFYSYVMTLKDQNALAALELMEMLLKYGDNFMLVDYYFAQLILCHQFALNRSSI